MPGGLQPVASMHILPERECLSYMSCCSRMFCIGLDPLALRARQEFVDLIILQVATAGTGCRIIQVVPALLRFSCSSDCEICKAMLPGVCVLQEFVEVLQAATAGAGCGLQVAPVPLAGFALPELFSPLHAAVQYSGLAAAFLSGRS